jgi:adenylate cyclase
MTNTPDHPGRIRFGMLARVLATADAEAEMMAGDPVLRQALANEGRIGRRIVTIGRDTATVIIAALLPFLGGTWDFLYYEAMLALFWLSGRQQIRLARIGRSWTEVVFILGDILLLTFIAVLPNPFSQGEIPTAFGFRWNTFDYLFLVLAFATLAYSWRTVWTIGVTVAVVWLAGAGIVDYFGHEVPLVAKAASATAAEVGNPQLKAFLDLNNVQWNLRVQEVVVFVLVAAALTLKGWRSNQLLIRQARLAAERANLSRYFAPTIVDRLASQPAALQEPQTREIAVMFTDLVGFTDLAERLPDTEVLPLLRRYYAEIERVVFDEGGTLDKYLGDGVMATFGTPVPAPGNAGAAIRAARRIVEAIDTVGHGLHVSVGVHFGSATVGDVGPARRLEFAVIGDTVNVASRLEAATREIDARIVISDAVVARARAEGADDAAITGFTALPALGLRGRRAAIDVWVFRG